LLQELHILSSSSQLCCKSLGVISSVQEYVTTPYCYTLIISVTVICGYGNRGLLDLCTKIKQNVG